MTIKPLTALLSVLAFALAIVAGIPQLRQKIRNSVIPEGREIVAKIEGSPLLNGPKLSILKIKTRDQFFIEIYRLDDELNLIQRIALDEPTDGFFDFRGQYTNLALADLDRNGEFEIVSPMYDRNGTPRLLIFKYNPDILTFERMTSE
jgi:hypothetical protein